MLIRGLKGLSSHKFRMSNATPIPVRLVHTSPSSAQNCHSQSQSGPSSSSGFSDLPSQSEGASSQSEMSQSEAEDQHKLLGKPRRKRKHGLVHSGVGPPRSLTPLSPPSTPPPIGHLLQTVNFKPKGIVGLAALGYDANVKVLNLILVRHAESQVSTHTQIYTHIHIHSYIHHSHTHSEQRDRRRAHQAVWLLTTHPGIRQQRSLRR
jgi:hypothetical protein